MDNKMVVLNHDGEAVCSIPFGLDTSEDMIADDIKPCSEEDLLSLTMTMPLEEGASCRLSSYSYCCLGRYCDCWLCYRLYRSRDTRGPTSYRQQQ